MPSKPIFFPQLKRRNSYPSYSRYNRYRDLIREDCRYRCVYCDIHELELGRELETRDERMTLDHFRPQAYYENLQNDPLNLVLCCPVCNRKKADDWPAYDQRHGGLIVGNSGYIDPFADNRSLYFQVSDDGSLVPLRHPASYMIRLLVLNRSAAKRIRRRRIQLYENLLALESYFEAAITKLERKLNTLTTDDQACMQRKLEEKLLLLENLRDSVTKIEQMISLD